ncbi:MAG TPA: hydrolase [Gemmatimonadaceae bacterium]|nr:hydrolase [Gemmatimonadaceae bacterium]
MPAAANQPSYTGLNALLTPENSALLLIDHQGAQFANLHSHEPQLVVNNVVALAKTAKLLGVPTVLTTVVAARSGNIIGGIQSVFPNEKPIDRTFINAWQDAQLANAVKKTGRNKLVMAGLWTEVCVAMPAIQAQGEGYDVYVVSDASGGVSVEAHAMAMDRMTQAGIKPITWLAVLCEWQRDWAARQDEQAALTGILIEHGGSSGAAFAWGYQLLGSTGKA